MTTIQVEKIGPEELKVIEGLPMIVIYRNPADFPDKYVARLWDIQKGEHRPTEIAVVSESIADLRYKIPWENMYVIHRSPEDDPCILETWI